MGRRTCKRGPISGGPPETVPWIWLTRDMLAAPTWSALSISARRILDAMMVEYMSHAGHENGSLAVTYRQLEALGVTGADIRQGQEELIACGFVQRTHQGLRLAGGGEPSRFALTWLPSHRNTPKAAPATDDWRDILARLRRAGILDARGVRKWLKGEVKRRPSQKRKQHSVDIEGAPQVSGEDCVQMRGKKQGNIIPLASQVRGGAQVK